MNIIATPITRLHNYINGKVALGPSVTADYDQIIATLNTLIADAVALNTGKTDVADYTNLLNLHNALRGEYNIHRTSADHDARYYIKSQIDSMISTLNATIVAKETVLNQRIDATNNSLLAHRTSTDHDVRYYTKNELLPYLRGGDTLMKREAFTILASDNGDGTFTYQNGQGAVRTGTLGGSGEQRFTLETGMYNVGENRLEIIVNDTLHRSAASGGITEDTSTSFILTQPEGDNAEITATYFERIGMASEYNIKLGTEKPPLNDGKTMWYKIVG